MDYLGHGRWGLKHDPPTPAPKGAPRLKKIKYKPEYDDPTLAKKKPARRKKSTRRSRTSKATTATRRRVTRPKKQLPKMKKSWWPFW
jgi:hypothetical protein